jgi:hypothetical protein
MTNVSAGVIAVLNSRIFEPRGSGEVGLAPRSQVDRVEHNTE